MREYPTIFLHLNETIRFVCLIKLVDLKLKCAAKIITVL